MRVSFERKVGKMKGTIKVNKLNKSGLFISEVDWDKCYKSESNPDGNFVMIIEPLEGCDKGIIYYEKVDNGYLIMGEAYIIQNKIDRIEAEKQKWKAAYKSRPINYVKEKIHN